MRGLGSVHRDGGGWVAYEDRIVGYLDVLGWSELLQASADRPQLLNPVMGAALNLSSAKRVAEKFGTDVLEGLELRAAQFSDCFVVSALAGRYLGPLAEDTIAMQLATTSALLLRAGLYARGAMVRGQLYHRHDMLFGPALVRAYRIERDVSRFPRIVVEREVQAALNPDVIRLDYDGLVHLHILRRVRTWELHRIARSVRKKISRDHAKLDRYAKHTWMRRYIGETLRRREGLGGRLRFDRPQDRW